jgi:salicylate biosynthesis isochorismate synthase/menaquinone-specific isochorismate synthase
MDADAAAPVEADLWRATSTRRAPDPYQDIPREWFEPRDLDREVDLLEVAAAARAAGQDVALLERQEPGAVSVAGIGRRFDIVSTRDGAALEDADGRLLDREDHPDHLMAAARLWQRLVLRLRVPAPDVPGAGLVAIGGFAFDPQRQPQPPWSGFPSVLFRVPALLLTRSDNRILSTGDQRLLRLQPRPASTLLRFHLEPALAEQRWAGVVARAAERLRAGEADKVVMAREVVVKGDGSVSPDAVASALRSAYPACWVYSFTGDDGSTLVGASPELLLRREGDVLVSQPMAGSVPRGRDAVEDEVLAAQLQKSAKDTTEHLVTVAHVAGALAALGARVAHGTPQIVRLDNIQHLATTVRAVDSERHTLLEIARWLHPTPAVNGWPTGAASRLICELEGLERGWYAGAVGWMDGWGDGELMVSIRCGLISGDQARLYAGSGIMPGSEPGEELVETNLKLRALVDAMAQAKRRL